MIIGTLQGKPEGTHLQLRISSRPQEPALEAGNLAVPKSGPRPFLAKEMLLCLRDQAIELCRDAVTQGGGEPKRLPQAGYKWPKDRSGSWLPDLCLWC